MTAGVTTADPKEFAVDCAPSTVAPGIRQRQRVLSVERNAVAALVVIVILGFVLRIRGLDRAGFNEDEVQKVNAAHAYLRGDFLSNLEHPMLMKSLIAVSLAAAGRWNRGPGRLYPLSDEFAVRLPNVIFGALTSVVIFGLAQEFFSLQVALLSALFWSSGTIAIMDNRIAKEDTMLVFFAWLGYYFYIRAKKASAISARENSERSGKWYAAAGASFGLMLASKYFPHYLGLIFLYYLLPLNKGTYPPLRKRDYFPLFSTCTIVFLAANPVVLLPSTIKYMLHYAAEGAMTHHGYLMMGRFYFDDPAHLRGGMPWYFYLLLLAIKTPIPVLFALAVGIVEVIRRRKEPGPSFIILMSLLWIVPFSLLSAKWLRWMLTWMPTIYIIAAIGLVKIFSFTRQLLMESRSRFLAPVMGALIFLVFLAQPLWAATKAGPYYSLYVNPLGFGHAGFYFPHDEFEDAGLRPAIFRICNEAPIGSAVGGEAPPLFAYYLQQCGRSDLRYFSLSDPLREAPAPSTYVVVEDGRKYFDNIPLIRTIESEEVPVWTVAIDGVPAATVYRNPELAELRNGHASDITLR
jgi:hypothetical protein